MFAIHSSGSQHRCSLPDISKQAIVVKDTDSPTKEERRNAEQETFRYF
jgi:hypothetical protein